MKQTCYAIFLSASLLAAAALARGEEKVREEVSSENGRYLVTVEDRKVEVRRVDSGPGSPPYLRMRVRRKNDRPLEVHLKTIESPPSPARYTGRVDQWNDSVMGLELEFSFDKKTWKRLGRAIGALSP